MRPLTHTLFHSMRRIDGLRFNGFLTTPMGYKEEDMYHRVLNVRKPTTLKVGDIVIAWGAKVLLMEYPPQADWYANFRAAYINAEYLWQRTVKGMDPVALVPRDFQHISMGTIYAYMDKPKDVKVGTLIDTKYSFYTGQDVWEGDSVGGKIVKRVQQSMGVKLVHVE